MRIYNVEYNPKENEGVYALSVVKSPAMQSNWITLSEQKKTVKLATVDEERRILMGIALVPNKPIFRSDESGDYNLVFSSKTIVQAAHDFVKKGNVNNSTLEHEIDLGSDAVSVVESWIIEDDVHDKTRKFGFTDRVGSWAVMMKVHDDKVWQDAKDGKILGFSIDGIFNLKEITKNVTMSKINESKGILQRLGEALIQAGKPADVKLAGSVLTADGVEVMYDGEALEVGTVVFIENEGEQVPLPVGEYALEDGTGLIVAEEGIVSELTPVVEAEPEGEAELSDDDMNKFFTALEKRFGLNSLTTQLAEVKKENAAFKLALAEIGKQPATAKLQAKKEVSNYVPKTARERILFTIQKNSN
jgi:hypothetical protein